MKPTSVCPFCRQETGDPEAGYCSECGAKQPSPGTAPSLEPAGLTGPRITPEGWAMTIIVMMLIAVVLGPMVLILLLACLVVLGEESMPLERHPLNLAYRAEAGRLYEWLKRRYGR